MRETRARTHHTRLSRSLSLILSCSSWEQVLAQLYKPLLSSHWGHPEKLYLFLPHGDGPHRVTKEDTRTGNRHLFRPCHNYHVILASRYLCVGGVIFPCFIAEKPEACEADNLSELPGVLQVWSWRTQIHSCLTLRMKTFPQHLASFFPPNSSCLLCEKESPRLVVTESQAPGNSHSEQDHSHINAVTGWVCLGFPRQGRSTRLLIFSDLPPSSPSSPSALLPW